MSISVEGNGGKERRDIMITVNAMGDNCPIPVIKTKKAMQALTGPETIEVLVDNEIAVQNVTKMASSSGGQVSRSRSRWRALRRQRQQKKKFPAHRTTEEIW